MTAKEYLKQYKLIMYMIENLNREIEELEEQITSVRSTLGDGMPKSSSTTSNTERLVPLLVDKKRRKEELKIEAEWRRLHIEDVIDLVADPIYNRLLRDRYIRLYKWEDIAEDLNYNAVQYVRQGLHNKALDAVEDAIANRNEVQEST